jgi:hypothetical protein
MARMIFSKFEQTTVISIFCGGKHRRPMSAGIWCHLGNSHEKPEFNLLEIRGGTCQPFFAAAASNIFMPALNASGVICFL